MHPMGKLRIKSSIPVLMLHDADNFCEGLCLQKEYILSYSDLWFSPALLVAGCFWDHSLVGNGLLCGGGVSQKGYPTSPTGTLQIWKYTQRLLCSILLLPILSLWSLISLRSVAWNVPGRAPSTYVQVWSWSVGVDGQCELGAMSAGTDFLCSVDMPQVGC